VVQLKNRRNFIPAFRLTRSEGPSISSRGSQLVTLYRLVHAHHEGRDLTQRRTGAEFVDFLEQVVSGCKPQQEIHIILDNLSAHRTHQVEEFLKRNPNAKLHFTPTYSSWLNQVEIWFARLEREVIARGIFTSVQDLSRKLMRYIRAYSKTARPFKWKYADVRRRILPC
jgi:transposase